jgi:hypothetical protein
LIDKDAKSAEIIYPILQGKDIRGYGYQWANLWLINVHNGIKEKGIKAIDINNYPAIKEHLYDFYQDLEKRTDKGITPYNLRNCAYLDKFANEKIIWQGIAKRIEFGYDVNSMYIDVTSFFMAGESLKYILAILNSKLFKFSLLNIYLEGDTFKSKNQIIKDFPLPKLNGTQQQPLITLVEQILSAKKDNPQADTKAFEQQIDRLVYGLYGLTEEEIKIIEGRK